MKSVDTEGSNVGRLVMKKAAIRRLSLSLLQRIAEAANADLSMKRANMERTWIQSKDTMERNEVDLSVGEEQAVVHSAADGSLFR